MKKLIALFITSLLSCHVMANLVVIGNHAGVDALSKSDVKKLYMGKKTKLANGTKVHLVELQEGLATRISFHQQATGRSESQLQSAWSRLIFTGKAAAPTQVADYAQMITEVSSHANAIGYIDESALTSDVKVLLKL